jgi:hypothetical protein
MLNGKSWDIRALHAFSFTRQRIWGMGDAGQCGSGVGSSAATYRNYGSKVKYYNEVVGITHGWTRCKLVFYVKLRHLEPSIITSANWRKSISRADDCVVKLCVRNRIMMCFIFSIFAISGAMSWCSVGEGIKTDIHYLFRLPGKSYAGLLQKYDFPISEDSCHDFKSADFVFPWRKCEVASAINEFGSE